MATLGVLALSLLAIQYASTAEVKNESKELSLQKFQHCF